MDITFNGPAGAVINPSIPDSSGNGYNLTLINPWSTGASYASGKFGNAMHFSGGQIAYIGGYNWATNSYQTNPLPQNLNSWTASVWVNFSAAQDGSWLPAFGTNWASHLGNGTDILFNPSSNGQAEIQSWVMDNTGAGIVGNWEDIHVALPAGQWNLITETVTAGQYNLYVNGVDVDSLTLNPSQTPLFMAPDADLTLGY